MSKRRRKKNKKKKNLSNVHRSFFEERMYQFNNEQSGTFANQFPKLQETLKKYKPDDILKALFISSIYLPNIAAPIKHNFWSEVFLSIQEEDFIGSHSAANYQDFTNMIQDIYLFLPHFSMLEDFVPTADWGEVKFFHNNNIFKIMYGGEHSFPYEYLYQYQIIFGALEEELFQSTGRSPMQELSYALKLQDLIISSIPQSPGSINLENVEPGHTEIPPEQFWNNAGIFYDSFIGQNYVPQYFIDQHSLPLSVNAKNILTFDSFTEKCMEGNSILGMFVRSGDKYRLFNPRRHFVVFIEAWNKLLKASVNQFKAPPMQLEIKVFSSLHKFIKTRLRRGSYFPLASACEENGKPYPFHFSNVLLTKSHAVFIHVCMPQSSHGKIQKHLEVISKDLHNSLLLLKKNPMMISQPLQKENIIISDKDGHSPKPLIFMLIPNFDTAISSLRIPPDFPAEVWTLDQFLGMVDELENCDELEDYLSFEKSIPGGPGMLVSPLDVFGAFKDSLGTLVAGAFKPDMVSLDPHWWVNYRYKTLKDFWAIYPEDFIAANPRSFRVESEKKGGVRLTGKTRFAAILTYKLGNTRISISAPLNTDKYQEGRILYFLMECIEDQFILNDSDIKKAKVFDDIKSIHISVLTEDHVKNSKDFADYLSLFPLKEEWKIIIDETHTSRAEGLIHLLYIYSSEKVINAFEKASDKSLEVRLIVDLLVPIVLEDKKSILQTLIVKLEKTIQGSPRYKLFAVEEKWAFLWPTSVWEPQLVDFKKAKKRIAEIIQSLNIKEGLYEGEKAKQVINSIVRECVEELKTELAHFELDSSVIMLVSRIDALSNKAHLELITIQKASTHEVAYNVPETYANTHSKYLTMNRNYRYFIEAIVLYAGSKGQLIDEDICNYWLAYIDWLHVMQAASDQIHYGLFSEVKLEVSNEMLIIVHQPSKALDSEAEVEFKRAEIYLGIRGNLDDKTVTAIDLEGHMRKLESAFETDFGFSFIQLQVVLDSLGFWPRLVGERQYNTYYSASHDEICERLLNVLEHTTRDQIQKIIDFLTLKKENILKIIGSLKDEVSLMIPIWEHYKRHSRYTLKPLIMVNGKYIWGPVSCSKTKNIWERIVFLHKMPVDYIAPNVTMVLEEGKKKAERSVVENGEKVLLNHNAIVQKNLWLHKLDKASKHPETLGDYDLLAFFPQSNLVLNIECKDYYDVFCLKDASRLVRTIYGETGNTGDIHKLIKRTNYLNKHLLSIAEKLLWKIEGTNMPEIRSVFLTRNYPIWEVASPVKESVKCLGLEIFSDYLDGLLSANNTK